MTRWLVVGAGAAGCVVAARLSQIESNQVTLLEAGPDHGATAGAPGEPVLGEPRLLYAGIEVVRRPGTAPTPYAQGFGIGGSSLVNGGVVVGDADVASIGHDLPIEPPRALGPVAEAVLRSTRDARPVALVARDRRRVSVADVYLRPAIDRPNLRVATGVTVGRVVFERRRALGVETSDGHHIEADRVVMCAGAIWTPTILLRSGVDTPGLGEGLQDHAGVAVSFDLVEPAAPDDVAIGTTVERPGRQIVVMDHLPGRRDLGALIAGHLAVSSTGRIASPDPEGPPVVELDQLATSSDLDGLVLAMAEALELVGSPAVSDVVDTVYVDDHGTTAGALQSVDALRKWVPSHLGGYHHLAGSCRSDVCLGPDGELIGRDHCYVADASALRGAPLRNPYLSVVRVAEAFDRSHAAHRGADRPS